MRRIVTTVLSLLAPTAAALAADLQWPQPAPIQAPPNWTGFYAGLNAGAAFGASRTAFSIAGFEPPSFDTSLSGAIGGAETGYDWQTGGLVLGLAADLEASGLQGRRTAPCIPPLCGAFAASYTQTVPWFGTVRPRIGYALGNWLLYATGGYAFARLDTDASAAFGPFYAVDNRGEMRDGWTLGGGAEIEFAPHWSAKIEYLYLDLGSSTTTFLASPPISSASHLDFSLIRAGLDYRF